MTTMTTRLARTCVAMFAFALTTPSLSSADVPITIVNVDGPNEGFNDSTPATPVCGNPGTTKGQQRLIAFQFAADIWGATLDSNVPIRVQSQFTPLGPNVLGAAGATARVANFPGLVVGFPGAAFGNTWYHLALANKRAGANFAPPGFPDIVANFSSDFDFYLGLDGNHGAQVDLVTIVLHELAHGLGFSSFMNPLSGGGNPTATCLTCTDIYLQFAHDNSTSTQFSAMTTSAQRAAAVLQVENVVWTGEHVTTAVPTTLSFGRPEVTLSSSAFMTINTRIGPASFGPPLTATGVAGAVVLAIDGVGPPTAGASFTDACEPLTNGTAVAGNIALVDRGLCTFPVKVKNAQNAGAIAVLVADNVLGNPPPGMTGTDPTISIPSARIQLATGDTIKAALSAPAPVQVSATLDLNLALRAGTDLFGRALLYASNPVVGGSTFSHWDFITSRNQLMEPAYNPDLTHNLIAPIDMTRAHFHDLGWFTDANLDGTPDATVIINGCDTGVPDGFIGNGAWLSDQVRTWVRACSAGAKNTGAIMSCMSHSTNEAMKSGFISGAQKDAIQSCIETPPGT